MSTQFQFFSINELGELPPPRWLIHEMFEAESLVMVAGPPGSFKSFLVLDWALCIASGRKWQGRETEESSVLYALGEGRSSLLKRVQTWIHYNKLSAAEFDKLMRNFKVTFEVPQMTQKAHVDNMLMAIAKEEFNPKVLIIDTFARSFVGLDENSQQDVGLWVDAADRLRATGMTVLFLHHTAKNTEFGVKYRGSTAIQGALDTAMVMVRDPDIPHGVKLTITKQKDHDEGDPILFQRLELKVPGAPDSSIVLIPYEPVDERYSSDAQRRANIVGKIVKENPGLSLRAIGRIVAPLIGVDDDAGYQQVLRWRKAQPKSVQDTLQPD